MKKVMIIEDDAAISDVLDILFKRAGYEVFSYPNGNFIFKMAFEIPDVFIIDKQLSGVDGLDVCKHLKQMDATKCVPVIILSASLHLHALIKQAGADALLEKPFSNNRLLEMVANLVNDVNEAAH